MRIFTILLAVFQIALSFDDAETFNKTFSRDILIGLATASYQIEGGWDADGKGESVWDRFVHTHPGAIVDGSTGDVAADSYHKVREDVQNLRDIGAQIYRFSISWSRVLPTGLPNNVNQRGVEYYDTLIRLLRAYDIEPVVTMFHWDLPQYLQDLGGWLNPHIVEYFREYARLLYENYGDRVTYWLTFNEPQQFCLNGYGNFTFAPGLVGLSGIADYQCAHNVLKSHAAAYHLYDDEYREKQNGRVGMAIPAGYSFTTDDDPKNIEAAERNMAFDFGWFTNPIFSEEGNYPQVMIDRIGNRSKLEGFTKSRLPEFTQEEIEYIKGTADFFGLNHYTSCVVSYIEDYGIGEYNFYTDKSTNVWLDDSWPTSASEWLRIVPEGFRKMLNWVKDLKDIDIIVTENGVSDTGGTDDDSRIDYFKQYLSAMLQAKYEDNVRVIGYTGWSLLDNFEWVKGYTERFGVYSIDFESESRTRTAKKSAEYLRKVIETRCLLEEGECEPL